MTAKQLDETLKALIANGKDLRAAGYTRIEVGEINLELGGADATLTQPVQAAPSDGSDSNPIDDPDTFGGHIPKRRGARQLPEREE